MNDASSDIEILRPDWDLPVQAGFTTRPGGASLPPYDALNLALHVDDDPVRVRENRRRLVSQAGLSEQPRWVAQVHGMRVVHADEVERDVTEADAVWTDQPGEVCAVLVADCLPVLLADPAGGCVAAVHAGWRGLAAGILQQTLATLPVAARDLAACIGPCIGSEAYEVGPDVIESIKRRDIQPVHHPSRRARDRFQLDLAATARDMLASAGVADIRRFAHCTHRDPARFFSYRRDGVTGRIAGYIACEPNGPGPHGMRR